MNKELFNQLLARIEQSADPQGLNDALLELCRIYRFDYHLFCLVQPTGVRRAQAHILAHTPADWLACYRERGYLGEDPLLTLPHREGKPLLWQELEREIPLPAKSVEIMQARTQHGLREGITLPFHGAAGGRAILSLSRSQAAGLTLADLPYLGWLGNALVSRASQLLLIPSARLSTRERECLCWASDGKTAWEVGKILGLSQSTVNFHLARAMAKFGSRNRYQVISHGLTTGQLPPLPEQLTLTQCFES